MKSNRTVWTAATVVATITLIGFAAAAREKKDVSQKSSETSVVTNDNGSVARTYTELSVTTNGSMVTERRRETRTTLDADGNMLESSTSEYAQSYPVGEEGLSGFATRVCASEGEEVAAAAKVEEGFLGLKFGDVFDGTNFVADVDEPTLLRASFTPKKALAGFDDYYVYVTPTTHKVVKVYACAKEAVDPGANWRRHYLIEALEKRYNTWARPRSWSRPIYTFALGSGRFVTACLAGASRDYETVLVAWDDALLTTAADETEAIRVEARKQAVEKRRARVDDAASAF